MEKACRVSAIYPESLCGRQEKKKKKKPLKEVLSSSLKPVNITFPGK